MTESLSFALQAVPTARDEWLDVAGEAEARGFTTLCVSDHPGVTPSPFVALAAAATVTTTIGLGTAVVNLGVRHPFDVAADAAALDRFSGGRAELGTGAGHTPAEWAAIGLAYPSAAQRIARLTEAVPLLRRLLDGGTVDHDGNHFRLRGARLDSPPDRRVPLLVGGNRALARATAAHADWFEVSGLGRTLSDGHLHMLRWSTSDVDALVAAVREGSGKPAPGGPQLGALVQLVVETDDAERSAARFLADLGARLPPETLPTVDDLLAVPFALVGTTSEIVDKLLAARSRWGFTRYTVRAGALEPMTRVLGALRERGELNPG